MTALILAAAKHPKAQARVRQQIDMVIGKDRSQSSGYYANFQNLIGPPVPSFRDWDELSELHAFIAEGMRWRPVVPIGMQSRRRHNGCTSSPI